MRAGGEDWDPDVRDTFLRIGMNTAAIHELHQAARTDDASRFRHALDQYRSCMAAQAIHEAHCRVVLGMPVAPYLALPHGATEETWHGRSI